MRKLFDFAFSVALIVFVGNASAITDTFDVGGGAVIPLPPGEWSILQDSGTSWGNGRRIVLGAKDVSGEIPLLSFAYTQSGQRWSDDPECFSYFGTNKVPYVALYGSKPGALKQKCAIIWGSSDSFSQTQTRLLNRGNRWWTEANPGLSKGTFTGEYSETEIHLRDFGRRNFSMNIFVRNPIRRYVDGNHRQAAERYEKWLEVYVDALQKSFQERLPPTKIAAIDFYPGDVSASMDKAERELAGNAFAISGSYDVGGGASVPLPKGEWSLLQKSGSTAFGDNGEVVVLENSDPAVSTKLLVIHHTRGAERWRGDAQCFKKPGGAHTELYGSKKSALVVKCSRTWVHNGSFSSWVSRRNHKYWTEATEGLRKASIKGYFIQTEIELRNFNGRNVNVDLFTETPKTFRGKPVNYFYLSSGNEVSEWYLSWVEAYTESLQATFQYKKKAAPLLALGFGARSVADGPKKLDVAPVVTADSAPGKSLSELLAVATDEGARPAESIFIPITDNGVLTASQATEVITQGKSLSELLAVATDEGARPAESIFIPITDNGVLTASQTTEVTSLSKVSPEPLAAAGLPSKQETQALAKLNEARIAAEARAKQQTAAQELLEQERLAVEDRAKKQLVAQQQLEQDRLALAKQKDSIAADLAAMRTMLAELKKANEEAANAEQVAAAPTAVETPAKPVVMARRRALVVGNETYKNVPVLENAAEDARAMAVALTGLGYEVDTHIDLTERGFKRALREFRADLNGGEEVLFFFAGHGVQLGNSNFLLPTDLGSDSAEQVKDESIELQKVLNDLADQKTKFALAVIDACRDNPFKQNGRAIGGRGLAPTTAATGQMVMFSAGAGQQALDKLSDQDKGKNGLFTRVFLEEMKRPGVSVDRVLRNVRQRVVDLARSVGHEQVPALYDQAVGEFYFKPK